MSKRGAGPRIGAAVAGVVMALLAAFAPAFAGTTGKISGRIVDEKKQPLEGVNVAVPAARTGALTDADGRFTILNVPPGSYEVKIALLGYQAMSVQNVLVSADNTTRLDRALGLAPVDMKEIVVDATRPVVDLKLTSSTVAVSRQEIAKLPVQELQDIVNLQAGVVDGHFRGGRLGEVQYQVDGVSVNNAYDNKSTVKVDRSLLEEVQVISGTFDAEYGQALSGVVNAVLRQGTDRFRWDAEIYRGGFLYQRSKRDWKYDFFKLDSKFDPGDIQSYQFSLSGPTRLPATTFLANVRRSLNFDYLRSDRVFNITDRADFQTHSFWPTGDRKRAPMAYSREWSGVAKLDNRSLKNINVSYQALVNLIEGLRADRSIWNYRYLPDALTTQNTFSITHGLDWTQTLAPSTYYTINLRQNYFNYTDRAYESYLDGNYDAAGPLRTDPAVEENAYFQGVDFGRNQQTTNTPIVKGTFVSQVSPDLQLRFGAEMQWPELKFGTPGYVLAKGDTLRRTVSEFPNYPPPLTYHPVVASAFAQEELELEDLRIRAGLRFEYFDANSSLPADLRNPADTIPGAPRSPLVATTTKVTLAPRIGVSYPIGTNASVFFAYGHFYQMPGLGDAFRNSDYRVLANLQAAGSNYKSMGNPDIRPERTVQYQFGYRQALTSWLGLDVNAYYKDVTDLLGTQFVITYNEAEYSRLSNADFGNVLGFTVSLDQRARGAFSSSLDYTWQIAKGDASDPAELANLANNGLDARPEEVPLNWDQRHTLNLTLEAARPDDFTLSAVVRVASGQPYQPERESGFGGDLERNSGRKPAAMLVDLRGEKTLGLFGAKGQLFARVFNLLDSRFFNGFVFANSGHVDFSSDPAKDYATLADPTRFYPPRRIELGIALRGGE